jgi:hypothetical protein
MARIFSLLVGLLFLFAACANGQVSFVLKATPPEIFRNDQVQVEYIVKNAGSVSGFAPPVFKGWNIVSGPSYSQEETVINGQSEKKISYIYLLSPEKPGRLMVPATSIDADGKKLFCQPAYVTVLNKNNPSPVHSPPPVSLQLQSLFDDQGLGSAFVQDPVLKPGERPDEKIRNNIFVKVFTSKSSCYVGEPILVTYKLYTGLKSESKVVKQPAFSGCSVLEMTTDDPPGQEQLNGKNYRVFLIRKVQLTPLQPGPLQLGTASVDNEVSFALADQSYRTQSFSATLSNQPVVVQVKPLPESNKPEHFSGMVGQFTLHAETSKGEVPAGDNNSLLIDIGGSGSVDHINLPAINWPAGVDHFDAAIRDNIDKLSFPESGTRTFEIPFIGSKEGEAVLPPITFNYFDPEKNEYREIHTDSIPLRFSKAVAHSLKDNPAIIRDDFTTRKYLWIVPAIAVAVIVIFWVITRRDKKRAGAGNTVHTPKPAAGSVVAAATDAPPPPEEQVPPAKIDFTAALEMLSHIEDDQLFFTTAKQLLTQAMGEALATSNNEIPQLLAQLQQKEEQAALAERCAALYRACDHAIYSPFLREESRAQVQQQLQRLVHELTGSPNGHTTA